MKLKQIGSNQTELHLDNGTIVLFSYETPVAFYDKNYPNKIQITKTYYSRTTTKHVNQWLNNELINHYTGSRPCDEVEVDQSVLDELVKTSDQFNQDCIDKAQKCLNMLGVKS